MTIGDMADDAKSGREAEAAEGCVAVPRELERLEIGAERNLVKLNRRRCKVLHLGRKSAGSQAMPGAASFAERDLVVLAENMLTTRQLCTLVSKAAKSLQGGVGQSVANRSWEVIMLSLWCW